MKGKDEEFYERLAEHEAIKSLCRSLVVRALRDYISGRNATKASTRRLYKEASDWIFNGHRVESVEVSPDPIVTDLPQEEARKRLSEFERLMRFESVCDILGWDAGQVRKMAKALTQSDLDRIGPNLMDL